MSYRLTPLFCETASVIDQAGYALASQVYHGGAVLPTRGKGLGFVTNQDIAVGQLVDLEAITLYKLFISFNPGRLAYERYFYTAEGKNVDTAIIIVYRR
jgi:hypothetical protein